MSMVENAVVEFALFDANSVALARLQLALCRQSQRSLSV